MGNCQCQTSAAAAAVVIHHPGNKTQNLFWSIKAGEVMNLNAGHYVALIVTSPEAKAENGSPLKYLKLLRPDDMLLVGHAYRLVSFEDVLKEFTAKKTISIGKLTREEDGVETKKKDSAKKPESSSMMEQEEENLERNEGEIFGRRSSRRGHQWRPSLQSIAEARG